MFEFENEYTAKGYHNIAGVDEAGRGPLAGPVCAACVIMPSNDIIEGINDSKKLSEKKRNALYDLIIEKAISYSIEMIDHDIIDEINILQATKLCMENAISKMSVEPDMVLIDAVNLNLPMDTIGIIKGDAKSYSIAAASILAKVTRDRYMVEMAKKYPEYGFEKHKGYGTKVHIEALKTHGACSIHRRTFIKKFV